MINKFPFVPAMVYYRLSISICELNNQFYISFKILVFIGIHFMELIKGVIITDE